MTSSCKRTHLLNSSRELVSHFILQTSSDKPNCIQNHSWPKHCAFLVMFPYPIRRFIVRSRKVSKPRDLYLELSNRSEIWQAHRQYCCRCACQISKRCDDSNYQSRSFETSRDLTIRRLIQYWNRTLVAGRHYCVLVLGYAQPHCWSSLSPVCMRLEAEEHNITAAS